jgi:hypothetical protein
VQTEKTCQAVGPQFTPENFQRMAFKLLVSHGLDAAHGKFSWLQDSGFRTATRGLPSPREAFRKKLSSVVSNTSTRPASAQARCNASNTP